MLYATAKKGGLGQVLITWCCAAVGIGADQTATVSYHAQNLPRRIGSLDLHDLLEVPGVKTQLAAWGFRVSDVEEEDAQEDEVAQEETVARVGGGGGGGGDVDAGANRRRRAGAKKGSRHAQPVPDEYRGSGLSYKDYNDVMMRAGDDIRVAVQGGLRKFSAAEEVRAGIMRENPKLQVSVRTLVRFADDPSRDPARQGGTYFCEEFEEDIADGVRYLRAVNLPTYVWQVKETVRQHLVARTASVC